MLKITKGKWNLQENEVGWEILGDNFTVAMSNDTDAERDNKQALANGHLLVAAPDMYWALKAVFYKDSEGIFQLNDDIDFDILINALAKAEGKG